MVKNIDITILRLQHRRYIMSVVRVPSPNCPNNMSDTYKFDTGDPRNGNCILWVGNQVETLDHYNWRINLPEDPSDQVAGPLMTFTGLIFGVIFAVMTYYYTNEKVINGWFTGLLILIILCNLVMFIFGIIFWTKAEKEKEKNKAYRDSAPRVPFEWYNAV